MTIRSSEISGSSSDCEIVTTRTINFPRALVYRAWTDPEHLKNWWGPHGFTNTFNIFDLRVGGQWSFVMHGPERGNYPNECVFTVILEHELLIWDRLSKPLFQVEVKFDAISENETQITFKQKFEIAEECVKIRKLTAGKNDENLDRLEAELAKMTI